IPTFRSPEDAVRALGRLATYRSCRPGMDRFESEGPVGRDADAAGRTIAKLLAARGPGDAGQARLDHDDQARLLSTYAVEVVPRRVVADDDEAVAAAEELGWTVALKADTRNRRARAAASGVALDIVDEQQMRVVWARMAEVLDGSMTPAVVQRFVDEGID